MITHEILKQICPRADEVRLAKWVEPLNAAMDEWKIETPLQQAAFLAQCAHESGQFYYVREIASGEAYEGRKDLGNTEPGDGVRYKGRGLLQCTGRANYAACAAALGLDLLAEPHLLEAPENAARSAAWFWWSRKLNGLADADNFRAITLKINGGLNGFKDRLAYYERAKEALA